MKTEPTPGPWRVSGCQMGDKLLIEHGVENTRSPLIGSVYTDGGALPQEANARLIAAAPDLHDALRALTDWGREHTSPNDPNSPHELLIAAVAALAKAESR